MGEIQKRSEEQIRNLRGVEAITGDGDSDLAGYCAGEVTLKEKQHVLANWKEYGTYYPGVVDKKHDDGSVDVLYDDGWLEEHIAPGAIKPVEGKEKKAPDDAACEVLEDVEDIKKKLQDAESSVKNYLAGMRAAATGKSVAAPVRDDDAVPLGIAAAPAPAAAATPDARLQALKDELSQVNAEISEAEAHFKSNAEVLKDLGKEQSANALPRTKTVEDLIAEYTARVAERKEVLRKLKEAIRLQEQEMVAMGAPSVSLEAIEESIKAMGADIKKIKAKRDRLQKEGRLDPELRAAIDGVIGNYEQLVERVFALIQAKAKADEIQEALAAAEEAAKAAAAKAAEVEKATNQTAGERKVAETPAAKTKEIEVAEAAVVKTKEIEEATKKSARQAELEVFEAGEEVEKRLEAVTEETDILDTGVHAHGDKWWRYRYEHSYVEAWLMIMLSVLLAFYVKILNLLRKEVYEHSAGALGARQNTGSHRGTLYTRWLEFTSLQMLACLQVFVTIWILDHLGFFEWLAFQFHGSSVLRLPTAGKHYRQLAFDLCVILIIAFLVYFTLLFSAVHAAITKMRAWAQTDTEDDHKGMTETPRGTTTAIQRATTFVGGSSAEFKSRKELFIKEMTSHPACVEKLRSHLGGTINQDLASVMQQFPFWKYLRLNVRAVLDQLLELGSIFWLAIILTFVVLLFCHGSFHMGYMRVMAFFLFMQIALLAFVIFLIYTANLSAEEFQGHQEEDKGLDMTAVTLRRESSLHRATLSMLGGMDRSMRIKTTVVALLQYNLFFLCYGASRFFCQPWMWRLHFHLTLTLTIGTVVLSLSFLFWIAPLMTTFAASMAMPPFLDMSNVDQMGVILEELKDQMSAKDFADVGQRQASSGLAMRSLFG